MPIFSSSTYYPPKLFQQRAHAQTIFPSVFRRLYPAFYKRECLELRDGDFLELDWSRGSAKENSKVAVVCHGLEGSSRAPYAKGLCRALNASGWDVALLNFRSCGGRLNRLARSYHSGETEDLSFVVSHVEQSYDEISLLGFSLGGNVVLKYLGEYAQTLPSKVQGAVAFSVPCDLAGSGAMLKQPSNQFYMKRFLRMLRKKVKAKHLRGDEVIPPEGIKKMSSFWEFDDSYTAPLHGFAGADDYYEKSSSRQFLSSITVPTLLINARNDPFLSDTCFPESEANESRYFYLEIPQQGGHCGFPSNFLIGPQWHEKRALEFLETYMDSYSA